jgi:hypothetical protein
VKPKRLLRHISVLAPSLTHLRLSGLQDSEWLDKRLAVAVGHTEDRWHLDVGRLPETIEMILTQPQQFGSAEDLSTRYGRLMRDLHEIQAADGRVCLLQPYTPASCLCSPHSDYDPVDNSNWLDYINGGEGCWDASDKVQRE